MDFYYVLKVHRVPVYYFLYKSEKEKLFLSIDHAVLKKLNFITATRFGIGAVEMQ